jgi:hypothetical protein
VDTTLSTLKGLPAADGADGVFYPGERSAAVAAERSAKGVPVAPKVWRDLTERAAELGVALPEAAGCGTAASAVTAPGGGWPGVRCGGRAGRPCPQRALGASAPFTRRM